MYRSGDGSPKNTRDQGFDSCRLFIVKTFQFFRHSMSLRCFYDLSVSSKDLPGSDDVSGDRGVVGLPGFRPGQLDRAGCEPDDHRLTGRLGNIWNNREPIKDLAGNLKLYLIQGVQRLEADILDGEVQLPTLSEYPLILLQY